MENNNDKIIWAIIGLAIGYFFATRKNKANIKKAVDKNSKEIEKTFDEMLAKANSEGLTVEQVRSFINS